MHAATGAAAASLAKPLVPAEEAAPLPESLAGIVIRPTRYYGNTALAAQEFAPGDVVIVEKPALVVRPLSVPSVIRYICEKLRISAQFFEGFLAVVSDSTMTPERIEEVFGDLYTPLRAGRTRDVHPVEMRATCMLFADPCFDQCVPVGCASRPFWESLRQAGSAGVVRFIAMHHAYRVNVHDCKSRAAIYLRCSKLAHSCNPNTWWYMQSDNSVVHVASRAIGCDETVSFSYLGTGLNLLSPTLARREQISHLSFFCRCPRCEAFEADREQCRALQCAVCASAYVTSPNLTCADDYPSRSLRLSLRRGGWFCEDCHSVVPYEAARSALSVERVLQDAIMKMFFGKLLSFDEERMLHRSIVARVVSPSPNFLLQQWMLCALTRRRLSADHFLYAVSTHALFRSIVIAISAGCRGETKDFLMMVQMLRARVPAYTLTTELIEHMEHSNAWFEREMDGSPQHVKLIFLVCEICTMLLLPRYTSDSGEYLLEFDERRMLDAFYATWVPRVKRIAACVTHRDYGFMCANPEDFPAFH